MLLSWLLHWPRYLAGHMFGHAALLSQWLAVSLDGLADGFMEIARVLTDVDPGEDIYDWSGFDDDDDEGGGLASPVT